ncbi:MAG: DNA-binding response regulator [Solirubrobacteraceae bacterium]
MCSVARPTEPQLTLRILTADPELRARRALELVIRDSDLPLAHVGHARSADELVSIALETSPHIVVLEPHMPGRSGLDALAELRPLQPGLRAIVLSRSDRFDDAERAIRLGVGAYLLKPLQPSRLRAALAEAVAEVTPWSASEVTRRGADLAAEIPEGSRACAFRLPDRRDAALAHQVDAALARLADAQLPLIAFAREHAAVLLSPGAWEPELDVVMRVRRSLPGAAQLGVGLPAERDDAGAALATALAAVAAGFFIEGEAIVSFDRLPAARGGYPIEHEEGMRRAIALGDMAVAARHVHVLSEALILPVRSPESARARFRDLIVVISRAFAARPPALLASLEWGDRWGDLVAAAASAPEAARVVHDAWEAAQRDLGSRPSSPVLRAQEFVREHAGDRIGVADVAAAVGFHPDHLSHLFRRELGETVGGYLARCRIERALDLLAHSNAPIAAVAAGVGFADARYFSRFFRRATGMSPREYRRSLAA